MKECIIALALAAICCLNACGSKGTAKELENTPDNQSNMNTAAAVTEAEESEMEINNRTLIANALGVDENARNMRFIMNSLKAINVGWIQTAELTQENGEDVLDITTKDQMNYRIYLSSSKKVDAIKDLSSGEWLITSER